MQDGGVAARLEAQRREAEEQRDLAKDGGLAARLEAQRREAEQQRDLAKDEVRSVRRDAAERFRRHAADMEALSTCLCDARNKLSEADGALAGARADAALCRSEAAAAERHGEQEHASATVARGALAPTKELATRETVVARQETLLAQELQSELAATRHDSRASALAEAAALQCARQSATTEAAEASLEALMARREAEAVEAARAESVESAMRAQKAADAEWEERVVAATLRVTLERIEGDLEKREQAAFLLDDAREAQYAADAKVGRLAEELRTAESQCVVDRSAAARAKADLEAAHDRVRGFEALRVQAVKKAKLLNDDLEAACETEAEERARWAAELKAFTEEEEDALAAAAASARGNANAEVAAARAQVRQGQEQVTEAQACSSLLREELEVFARRLREEEEVVLHGAEARQSLEAAAAGASSRFAEELAQAELAKVEAVAGEERFAAEHCAEATACTTLRKQVSTAKEKVHKLQELSEANLQAHEDRAQELAMYKARAMRDARSATELRAEIADVRRELAKHRHASKDLERTTEELEAARLKIAKAHRGRGATQGDVGVWKAPQDRSGCVGGGGCASISAASSRASTARKSQETSLARGGGGGGDQESGAWVHADVYGVHSARSRGKQDGTVLSSVDGEDKAVASRLPALGKSQSAGALSPVSAAEAASNTCMQRSASDGIDAMSTSVTTAATAAASPVRTIAPLGVAPPPLASPSERSGSHGGNSHPGSVLGSPPGGCPSAAWGSLPPRPPTKTHASRYGCVAAATASMARHRTSSRGR